MYQSALKHHPDNTIVLNDLGLCYARRGMLLQAQSSLERAVRKDPASKLYRNNLALVLVEGGRQEEALKHLVAAHGEAIAHYNLGFMLREKGQLEQATHHLQIALRLNPQMMPARQMLAELEPRPAPQMHAGQIQPQMGAPQWQGAPVESANVTARRQGWPQADPNIAGAPQGGPQGEPVEFRVGDRSSQPAATDYGPPVGNQYNPGPAPQYNPSPAPQYNPAPAPAPAMNQPRPNWGEAPAPGEMPAYMRGR
jgi:hypothetical protein